MSKYSFEKTPYMMHVQGKDPIRELEKHLELKAKVSNLLINTAIKQGGYTVIKDNELKRIEHKPAIFIANHTRSQDGPIMRTQISNDTYLLVGLQRLRLVDKFFFNSTVSMYVDRASKEDKNFTKDIIIAMLKRGHDFACFPETTWNLTDNQILIPFMWGYIKEAMEANAQIIPMSFVYDTEKKICHVDHLDPIVYDTKQIDIEEENERIRLMIANSMLKHRGLLPTGERRKEVIREILKEYASYEVDVEQSYVDLSKGKKLILH